MKKNRRFGVLFLVLMITCLSVASCTKRCKCIRNNMTVQYYTPEELSERGKTCEGMIYLDGLATQYYVLCEWEY